MPDVADLPDIACHSPLSPTTTTATKFLPYLRDPETLARPWAIPGTPRPRAPHRRPRESRTSPATSTTTRTTTSTWSEPARGQDRRHRRRHPDLDGRRPRRTAEVLVLGWGGTYGAIAAAVHAPCASGRSRRPRPPACISTRCPPNLGDVLTRFDKVLVPETEPRPARQLDPRRVPDRRRSPQQGPAASRSPPRETRDDRSEEAHANNA